MENQASIATVHRTSTISTTISKPLQFVGAFLLGAVIEYAAGFVSTSAVHNATHDMRHSQ